METEKKAYQPPYVARLGHEFTRPYTYENGQTANIRYHTVDVFLVENGEETKIGEYEVSCFKRPIAAFHAFKRGGLWYALTTEHRKLRVYSLPDMRVVAEEQESKGSSKVTDFYIPRFWHSKHRHTHQDGTFWFTSNHTLIDDEIEQERGVEVVGTVYEPDWEHADFGFVESYDPYCSGPNYVNIVDLSRIEEGHIGYKQEFWWETPEWLSLKQVVHLDGWTKAWPTFEIATVKYLSTVAATECGDGGWTKEQMGDMVPEDER